MQRSVVMEALLIKGSTRVISECERLQRYTMIPGTDSPFEKSRTCLTQLNPEKESYLTNTRLLKGSANRFIKYFSDKIKTICGNLENPTQKKTLSRLQHYSWLIERFVAAQLINFPEEHGHRKHYNVALYLNNSCLYRLIYP